MNLRLEEQILIKDIFAVSVNQAESALLYLPQFVRDVSSFGQNASLVEHSTYFDSLLMERLQVPQTDILAYLQQCWNRAEDARSKPWNVGQQQQAFIDYSVEIVKNFINLSLQEAEIFPEQMQIQSDISPPPNKTNEIARKMMTNFERRGLNLDMLELVTKGNEEQFREEILEVLITRQRFVTIIDSKTVFYLSTLVEFIRNPQFKRAFISMKNMNFVPGGQKGGNVFDSFTPLGLFMRLSILGQKVSGHVYQQALANQRFEERMSEQLGSERHSREKLKMYSSLQSEYYGKLFEAYKELMRKQSQKVFLEWNYRLLVSNLGRMKMGHRIYNPQNSDLSHDGLLLNAYSCLLGLCKAITSLQDDKWKSIDPSYFSHHERAVLLRGDPICSKPAPTITGKREFGTISEFFFLALQFLHVGVCGAMESFNMYNEMKKKMEKNLENLTRLAANHPMRKKAQVQVTRIQSNIIRYWILLNDQGLILPTIKLLGLMLKLLPQWMGIEYGNLRDAKLQEKPSELVHFLPELLLTLVSKYHTTMISIKQNYLEIVGEQHIGQVLELSCFLLSEQEIVTNPYISAGYVEMIYMFLHDPKAGVVHQQLRTSPVIVNNFTFGLIRFYCGIANTGRSNQFYQKFKYRQCANKIFTTLWNHECFRQNLKLYFQTSLFEKFINNILTDTNYCFDETNQNYDKYRQLLDRKKEAPLSQEDLQNEQSFERNMAANLQQCKSNLKLMRELSVWSPETFLTEADRKASVPLLNNSLRTFVEAGTFASNRELTTKFKFQSGRALSNVVSIYGNLDINEVLSNQIVKDGRNYKKEYFSKALQRASNEHYTSIDVLEKFEGLISKLLTAEDEEQNEEEIYGEIPEKYLCGISFCLMNDPVRLPGGQAVDRVNIKIHLLNDERDPFTRAPLKETALVADKALKDQIEKWKKHRLEQLKKGDKEVKYGKIAANTKQNEQGSFGMNPVVEEE